MSGWGYRSQSFFINQTKYKNGERTMSLKETINNDIKTAMKAKDKETLAVLRMIKTAIQAAEIDKKSELTAEEELTILSREAKQRRDSIVEFEKANRPELVEKTQGELVIVEKYLPAQLSLEEVYEAYDNGKLEEVFLCGTAAVIAPVGELFDGTKKLELITDNKPGEWTQKIYNLLTGIQLGKVEDKFGWVVKVEE